MTADELRWRVQTAVGHVVEVCRYELRFDRDPEPKLTDAASGAPTYSHPSLREAELDTVRLALAERSPEYAARLTQRADLLCRGHFEFFGRPFEMPPDGIDWTADPLSGRAWPRVFHSRVDIFSGDTGQGDVKFVWELNRHQFLVTLAKAWRLTGVVGYAERALTWVEDWIRANPYKVGINWSSALEVAVRSLSWLTAAGLLENAPCFSEARRLRLRRALAQHGRYLASHLSFYFSPYNHLIGEATALYAIGRLVPSLREAERWREGGWRILCDEVERQFHEDGGTVEQAFGYHYFTLGFYLQACLIASAFGDRLPDTLSDRLSAALRFGAEVTRPDGLTPMVGDADEGKALDLEQAHPWDFRSYLAVGATLFSETRDTDGSGDLHADAAWLVGTALWDRAQAPSAGPTESMATHLGSSGYVILREPEAGHWLLFDAGDIAHGVHEDDQVSAAHGHADLLTFELTVGGKPRLIDPGFLTYNGPVEWHRHFRDTQAHNALVVDGRSQARYRGRLKWSNGSAARLVLARSGAAAHYVEGEHGAYRQLPDPVTHTRAIAWLRPHAWVVLDRLTGRGTHTLDRHFHFAPGNVTLRGQACRTADTGGNLTVRCLETDGDAALVAGGPAPDGGWVAERYEQKVPAATLRYRVVRAAPAALLTVITADEDNLSAHDASLIGVRGVIGARLGSRAGAMAIIAWAEDGGGVVLDEFETDADMAMVELTPDGVIQKAALIRATRFASESLRFETQTTSDLCAVAVDGTLRWQPWEVVS